jgi:type IV pilus assembly protein PilC
VVPTFKYAGIDPEGQRVKGTVDGYTAAGVTSDLLDRGLDRVKVRERKSLAQVEITTKNVKPVNLMHLSRQLAAFLRAGVPILQALEIVHEEISDKTLANVVLSIADSLRRGETFAEAAAAYDKVFPPFYIGVLRSAEVTGRLDDVLEQLSKYIERDLEAKRKIKSSLAYPAIIMVLSIVTVGVLAGFVLPRFKTFFESFDAQLPLATRMLIAVTDFIVAWGATLLVVMLLLAVGLVLGLTTAKGKYLRDAFLLKVPVLGDVVRYSVIERFCRLFASMVQAGIPIPDAMTISSEGANNRVYGKALTSARQAMLQGEGISGPIARTGLFPGSATQMIRVGEETGSLDQQLEVTAKFFEQELEYKLKKLNTLFEPMAILFMGFIVGFVAIALVSAIYGIYSQVEL